MKVTLACGGEVDLGSDRIAEGEKGAACSKGCFHTYAEIIQSGLDKPVSALDSLRHLFSPAMAFPWAMALLLIALRIGWIRSEDAAGELIVFGRVYRIGYPVFLGRQWDGTELIYGAFLGMIVVYLLVTRLPDEIKRLRRRA